MEPTEKDNLVPDLTAQVMEGLSKRPVIAVDYDRYAHFLKNSDGTEEQKREFLQALWSIMVNFVDLGFGVHPLQQACGQLEEIPLNVADIAEVEVEYSNTLIADKFEISAACTQVVEERESKNG